jgi:hypothetical protein
MDFLLGIDLSRLVLGTVQAVSLRVIAIGCDGLQVSALQSHATMFHFVTRLSFWMGSLAIALFFLAAQAVSSGVIAMGCNGLQVLALQFHATVFHFVTRFAFWMALPGIDLSLERRSV